MNASLTTHVLDTAQGRPANGIAITLLRVDRAERTRVGSGLTNADGRTNDPLGTNLPPGTYEMIFDLAQYFENTTSWYDIITVRVVLDGLRDRHHVPLLLAPFGYSTYRGS